MVCVVSRRFLPTPCSPWTLGVCAAGPSPLPATAAESGSRRADCGLERLRATGRRLPGSPRGGRGAGPTWEKLTSRPRFRTGRQAVRPGLPRAIMQPGTGESAPAEQPGRRRQASSQSVEGEEIATKARRGGETLQERAHAPNGRCGSQTFTGCRRVDAGHCVRHCLLRVAVGSHAFHRDRSSPRTSRIRPASRHWAGPTHNLPGRSGPGLMDTCTPGPGGRGCSNKGVSA